MHTSYKTQKSPLTPEGGTTNRSPLGLGASTLSPFGGWGALLVAFLFFSPLGLGAWQASAQTPTPNFGIGLSSTNVNLNFNDEGRSTVTDATGNVYVTGSFQGRADFDLGAGTAYLINAGSFDIFVAKYNSAGVYQWAFNIGGTGNDVGYGITVDASSNVYVTGFFQGTNIDFDPSAATNSLSSAGSSDIFVAKYSSAGAYQWAFSIGGANPDMGFGIAVDASNGVYVTGYFAGTSIDFDPSAATNALSSAGGANSDIFVAKYSSAGAYQWAFSIGGTNTDTGFGIAVDASNNVYLTGQFAGTSIDFDPSAATNALSSVGNRDIFVAKYSSAGAYQWAFSIGGTNTDTGFGIAVDASSNVYVTGQFIGTSIDFDPSGTTNVLSSAGGFDIFVAKYSSAGAYQWAFNIGGTGADQGYSVAVDASSNVYVTGQFIGTSIEFDPSGTTNALSSVGGQDIFVAKYSSAGAYQWAFSIGGASNDIGYGITVDASSNVYVTGFFQGTNIDFDPSAATNSLSSAGSSDIFVAKYNTNNAYQWAGGIGGSEGGTDEIRATATDAAGNVYVTGYFQGTLDFDPSAAVANLTSAGSFDIFVAKYNSAGAYQWAFSIGGASNDIGYGIAVDASSNVYLTGYFSGTSIDFDPSAAINLLSSAGLQDVFVAKYSSAGAYQWAFSIGGTGNDVGNSIAVDASSNVYVTGYFAGTSIDFDPSGTTNALSSAGGTDVFVAKYSSAGAYQWAFRIGGTGNDIGYGIAVDASSNVYVTGYFAGTSIDFDPSAATNALSSAGLADIFVAKYSSAGAYQWAFSIGGTGNDVGNSIAVDASSNVYVTGYFAGTSIDFDPSGTTNALSSAGSFDIFVAKYNSAGAYQWAFRIGETNTDIGLGIAVDASNNVYLTGQFAGTSIDFDPSGTTNVLSSAGGFDIFVAKYSSAGAYQWAFNIGGTGADQGYSVAVDASSNLYLGGSFTASSINVHPTSTLNVLANDVTTLQGLLVRYGTAVPSTLQYRTKGTGVATFASPAHWESSPDGTTWSDATSAPDATANTLAINIQNGHTATVTADLALDELTISSGGTITVNTGVTLTINNGTGTDLTIQSTGAITGLGNFVLVTGATFSTADASGLNCIAVSGTKTFTAGANYIFNGTALQTINNPSALSANNFTVNNSAGATLSNNLTVTGTLTLTNGDLDLNGKNITLNGTLVENRGSNHIVKDLTATTDANQGGGIIFTSAVNTSTAELKGTGLHLQTTSGAYNVTVTRKHYKGAGAMVGGKGISRIYQITPDVPANVTASNTIMRIYYATDEAIGVQAPFELYRWTAATGWQDGTASSSFDEGTHVQGTYIEAINISAFSTWTVGSSAEPLPITLLGLKGERVEGLNGEATEEVRLEWATASEINNKGFEIQVSDNAQTYKTIAFIEGRGNSTTIQPYSHTTIQPYDSYYRLRQVDFDGSYSYSPVVFVEGVAGKVVVYPNPSNGAFTISVGKEKLDLPARLLNAQGVEVWHGVHTEVKTNLPSGTYFLHTTVAGKVNVTKIVIER